MAKSFHLSIPYFWDELGVYAPGSLKMSDTGNIGLLPRNLEPTYSRGHPLLCFFLHAIAYHIFGTTITVGHAFALFTNCCTLLVGFLFAKSVFSARAGLLFTVIMVVHPFFYAMSGVIAPENQLTLFTLLALWAMVKERWGWYVFMACCCVMTKESGLVVPATAALFLFIRSIGNRDFFTWKRWGLFLLAVSPVFLFGIFLLIQKAQNGWYFFPFHLEIMTHSWYSFQSLVRQILSETFIDRAHWIVGIPALIYLAVRSVLPAEKKETRDTLLVFTIFSVFAIVFAALNFYLSRYILYIVPLVMMVGAQGISAFAVMFRKRPVQWAILVPVTAVIVLYGCNDMDRKEFHDTTDMGYRHTVSCVQDCIHWAEKQPWAYELIDAGFPIFQGLDDVRNGYLSKGRVWKHSGDYEKDNIRHGMFLLMGDANPWTPKKYRIIKRFDHYYAHIVVVVFE